MMEPITLSLFQLATHVGNAIRMKSEVQNVWVTAELSDLSVKGGHCYTELIEKNEQGQTVARLRAMVWSSTYPRLASKFESYTGSRLSAGLKVKVKGSVTHHQAYGLSFSITDIDPEYTVGGDLERIRREILARLRAGGMIDDNKKLPRPLAPQKIAIISAPGAAGYGDFMRILTENQDGFVFYPILFPSTMQGDRTAPEVLDALQRVEYSGVDWDYVVIIRGGGATNDMTGFDNLELAMRICTFPFPVIVGIGHERDRCVLDEIAAVRCPTPTAVAGYLLDSLRDVWVRTYNLINTITREATLRVEGEKRHIMQLETAIPATVRQILERENVRLSNFTTSIPLAAGNLTVRERGKLDSMRLQLQTFIASAIERNANKLQGFENMLNVLSPENTLKRGYSITRYEGKAVRKDADAPSGAVLESTLPSGEVVKSTKL